MSGFDKLTLKDGSYLWFKDWGADSPLSLAMAGR